MCKREIDRHYSQKKSKMFAKIGISNHEIHDPKILDAATKGKMKKEGN